jgi:polyhydroxyalkanoate synthesis regulator phasin
MHPQMIAKQIIDLNKAAFDNAFDTIKILQDNTEKTVKDFLEKANLFPEDGKKVITDWVTTYKKDREDFKSTVDDNFKAVESFFLDAANALGYSLYELVEKTDQSLNDVTHKIKKASVEVLDKSIQTMAVVAEKTMLNRQIVGENKTGNVKAKAVGRKGTMR